MKAIVYTILTSLLVLSLGSCKSKSVDPTLYFSMDDDAYSGYDYDSEDDELSAAELQNQEFLEYMRKMAEDVKNQDANKDMDALGLTGDVRKKKDNVEAVDRGDDGRLKQYNVVVATLSQQFGINKLKEFFDRDGVFYFVVRNPVNNLHYFVVYSSDSEEDAIKGRANFLLQNVTNRSKADIWKKYYIPLTDAFILQRQ